MACEQNWKFSVLNYFVSILGHWIIHDGLSSLSQIQILLTKGTYYKYVYFHVWKIQTVDITRPIFIHVFSVWCSISKFFGLEWGTNPHFYFVKGTQPSTTLSYLLAHTTVHWECSSSHDGMFTWCFVGRSTPSFRFYPSSNRQHQRWTVKQR